MKKSLIQKRTNTIKVLKSLLRVKIVNVALFVQRLKKNYQDVIKKKRGLFDSTKIFPLKRGENIIGRKDPDIHSDIEIDDATISRRSITITVEEKGNSYKYRFKVNKCTNPIYVDGVQKELNTEYYIDPGAKIKLGKTTLELKTSAL